MPTRMKLVLRVGGRSGEHPTENTVCNVSVVFRVSVGIDRTIQKPLRFCRELMRLQLTDSPCASEARSRLLK